MKCIPDEKWRGERRSLVAPFSRETSSGLRAISDSQFATRVIRSGDSQELVARQYPSSALLSDSWKLHCLYRATLYTNQHTESIRSPSIS